MPYRLTHADADLSQGVRRIATEQLDRALAQIDGATGDSPEDGIDHVAVHEARKRMKKLRGLARLVRDGLPDYKGLNRHLRDSARLMSDLRDRTAVIETYDRLTERHDAALDRRRTRPVRNMLEAARAEAESRRDVTDRVLSFRSSVAGARRNIDAWAVKGDAEEVLTEGLARTYSRARRALKAARKADGATEPMHEWRKRVKYHRFHSQLLRDVWREKMDVHADAADRLGDILGEHHDLAELEPEIHAAGLDEAPRDALLGALAAERKRLSEAAFALGRPMFAEPAENLTRRWVAWWDLSRRAG